MSTENRGRREQHRERRSLGEKFQQWRQQRREWIAGMTRGQRIRHRLLQAAVVLAIAIIAVWAVMSRALTAERPGVRGDAAVPAPED